MTITYEIKTNQSGATEEWNSNLFVYQNDKQIACCNEGEGLNIRGFFDFKESVLLDEDGCPELTDESLFLSAQDLIELYQIIFAWEGDWDMPKHLEKKK